MQYIMKQTPPRSFIRYCKNRTASYQDLSRPSNVEIKMELRGALLNEQGHICCYCGREIDNVNSVIEHVKDKDSHPNQQLDYYNLACSCKGGQDRRSANPQYPLFCDAHKENFDILITPFEVCCISKFEFDEDGNIFGLDDAARETIKILNLNNDKLRNQRKYAIDEYRYLEPEDIDWDVELEMLSNRNQHGKFLPFCFVLRNYIETYKIPYSQAC